MISINLAQGDTDKRNAVLTDADGPIDLTNYTVILKTTFLNDPIYCVPQDEEDVGYTSWENGGISIPFGKADLATAGKFYGQVFLIDGNTQTTFPLGSYIEIIITQTVS